MGDIPLTKENGRVATGAYAHFDKQVYDIN